MTCRRGPLIRSRANAGQMVFPQLDSEYRVASACDVGVGRGLSLQNLHCSEVSQWPGDAAMTLAGFEPRWLRRENWCWRVRRTGHMERSMRNGCGGVDMGGDQDLLVRHFLPWWLEPSYVGAPVAAAAMNDEEAHVG